MKKFSTIALYSFLALALAFGLVAMPAMAADHLDGPMAKHDGRLDITDVYAFQSPSNPANTVLIMNVDPVAGVLSPTTFHPDASYDFKIDTNGDAKEDVTYKVTFSTVSGGTQNVQLRRVPAKGNSAVLARGQTGANIPVSGGGMLRVGVFDDPFFFDLVAFRNGLAFCPGGVGTDFFAGLNVASIVLEVPSSSLGTNIGVWARTTLGTQQIDRMGRPAINTVFEHTDAGKDAFNAGIPRHDQRDFHQDVFDTLIALGNTPAYAEAVTNILLPDILTFNTSSSAGFLNGRRLADDVIDTELTVISNGAITTDCVANDSTFSNTFPYLGSAN
jgi:Domain of unknown function (DUF4331)